MANAKNEKRTAAIIGCGVAGPVVAMALARVGVEPVIYEAYDEPADDIGLFLNVGSNGLAALRLVDATELVRAAGFPTPRMVMWSGTGKRLGEIANGLVLPDGTTSITVKRGDLHRVLREEALRRGIAVERGKRLVDVTPHPAREGATIHFEDGSIASASIVVGADGIGSRVRELVSRDAAAPRYTGLLSIGGIAKGTDVEPIPDAYQMVFGTRAFYGYVARPGGEVWWFANAAHTDPSSCRDVDWRARLLEAFRDDTGPAAHILERTPGDFGVYPIHDLPTVPSWHRGPMVLVGDAAHATSPSGGQGASMAFEDAVILAKCVRDVPSITEAFSIYEGLRRERVEKVVRYSARIGSSKVPGPMGRWFRDLLMPSALKLFAKPDAQAWMYGYRIDWSSPVA